jgi:hypothetical protein
MKPETKKMLEEAERAANSPTTLPPLDESKVKYCGECKRLRCSLRDEEKQYFN